MKSADVKRHRRITRLQAVSLGVSDFERAVTFYQDVLGLEVKVVAPGHYATIPQVSISLVSSEEVFASQGFHVELVVDDVDTWYQHLGNQGVTFLTKPKDQPWGARNFYMLDPEGHKLELTTAMP